MKCPVWLEQIRKDDQPLLINGRVVKKTYSYALIESNTYYGVHFLHQTNCPSEVWEDMSLGNEVEYNLGFTFSGAAAFI
ncbi:hypothetical protein F9817_17080 [Vibrio sp. CAIM 722]|uniref:Uncharacterized protein n=1 Tax=Vibrio eleionomae TaxID=2653505 RepID=A0A7X4LMU8_9VIBR|nr:hypothetical protein [Vibrio eleionomae]MZI94892.1 hypothetical protein [Vibrio eleionomae]